MTAAHDRAPTTPLRKPHGNASVTGPSAAVALVVGALQLATAAHERFGLRDAVTTRVVGVDTSWAGVGVVAAFALLRVAALLRARPRPLTPTRP